MVLKPTEELLSLFNKYGAKLSVMAEIAEILALDRYKEFSHISRNIEAQLKYALSEGHDVQLHIHPQWFNAKYEGGRWILDYDEYSLAHLPKEKMRRYIITGRDYLRNIGKEIRSDYKCVAFRAGHWLMHPSRDIVELLEEAGLLYDTSVFKWGKTQIGTFPLDYTNAYSELFPWKVDPLDINRRTDREGLYEIPIFTRRVFINSMFTRKRLSIQRRLEKCELPYGVTDYTFIRKLARWAGHFKLLYPKKFDFCRMTFKELKSYIDYAMAKCSNSKGLIPVWAIGHKGNFMIDGTFNGFLE